MTRYEAFIDKSWRKEGLAHLLVARIRESGVEIGVFLADLWCLGVKDAYFIDDATESDLAEILASNIPEAYRERIHPACAKKLIETAIAYAERLGFAPHRDFRKAKRVLSGLDPADCSEIFACGRDGKPCYVEGPDDTPERTEKVLAVLDAKFGPNGYDYVAHEESLDEDDEEMLAGDIMHDFLEQHPAPACGTYTELTGLLTSLQICPKIVAPSKILGLFTHPGHPEWTSLAEAQQVTSSLMLLWNRAGALLEETELDPENGFVIDLHEDDETLPLEASIVLWCRGFLRSLELWPDMWAGAASRPDLNPHFAVLRSWGEDGGMPDDHVTVAGPECMVTNAVIALYTALKPERRAEAGPDPLP